MDFVYTATALVVLLPLLGFIINGIWGHKLSQPAVSTIACGAVVSAFALSLALFMHYLGGDHSAAVLINYFEWLPIGANYTAQFGFLIDALSLQMLLIITGIGSLIHVYSIGYMHHDEGFSKFFAYLNLFIFSMLLLVLGNNFLVMFAGWEGVGLCSFLLIGFWFKNNEYNAAAKKAFVMNRIGDLGFLLAMFLIFYNFGSLSYDTVLGSASQLKTNGTMVVAITLLLFIGATGKSAQIPLYTWLPDAMAGPTPVSALIHAATMVTAGIYLIARCNLLFALAPTTLTIITVIGIATALLGATIALFQNDIKKVLAYSTVSQLGYMFVAMGLGAFTAGMFHVTTHAFFKALLFLGAGSVIHGLSGEQDTRKMGGLKDVMPTTFKTFFIGTIAIAGIPPLAGFFSKDEILLNAFISSKLLWILGIVGSLLTAAYMFKLLILTFFGTYRGDAKTLQHAHESPVTMTIPLVILAVFSAIGGFIGIPHIFGTNALHHFLAPVLQSGQDIAQTQAHLSVVEEIALMLIATAGAVAVLYFIWKNQSQLQNKALETEIEPEMKPIKRLLENKYYVDEIYNALIVSPLQKFSTFLHNIIDVKVIDGIVNGLASITALSGKGIQQLQTGNVAFYLFAMAVGLAGILALFIFS